MSVMYITPNRISNLLLLCVGCCHIVLHMYYKQAKIKSVGTTGTNKNEVPDELRRKINYRNTCYCQDHRHC
jgi:hypothetical protein